MRRVHFYTLLAAGLVTTAVNVPGPVAVHSYNLRASQARALRRQGVLVTRRLRPRLFEALQRLVRANPSHTETVL